MPVFLTHVWPCPQPVQGSLLCHRHIPPHKPLPVSRTPALAPPWQGCFAGTALVRLLSLLPGLPVHVLVKSSFSRNPEARWTRIPTLLSHPLPYLIRFPLLHHQAMSDHPGLSAERILLGRFSRNPQPPDFSLPNLPCTDPHLLSGREFPLVLAVLRVEPNLISPYCELPPQGSIISQWFW